MKFTRIILSGFSCVLLCTQLFAQVDRTVITSKALYQNKVNESNQREVLIYLPPNYETDVTNKYPALYLLHGYGENANAWFENPHTQGFHVQKSMDSLINSGLINEMIVVMPSCDNRFGGGWYTNSTSTGNWEDFISYELVAFIDSNYRTIDQSSARGIAGHSMGGYGALKIAMKHPDTFGFVYAMSSVNLASDKLAQMKYGELLTKLESKSKLSEYSLFDKLILSKALAFVPNDVSPYYSEYLFNRHSGELKLDSLVWQQWESHLLANRIDNFKSQNKELIIAFDHGSEDFLVGESREFSRKLHNEGIRHIFTEYKGGHTNKVRDRLENYVLPFFSKNFGN